MVFFIAKIESIFDVILNKKSYAERDTGNRLYKKINTILTSDGSYQTLKK